MTEREESDRYLLISFPFLILYCITFYLIQSKRIAEVLLSLGLIEKLFISKAQLIIAKHSADSANLQWVFLISGNDHFIMIIAIITINEKKVRLFIT